MTKRYLTQTEKQFLIENYPLKGINYCSEYLKLSKNSTKHNAYSLGLKLQKYDYIKDFYPITPQSAYILGFLTGDGHISKYSLSIEINMDDAIKLKNIFMFTNWSTYIRQRENWKEVCNYYICSLDLVKWLKSYDFHNKSKQLPNIGFISDEYLHLFLLGLFDADGCIVLNSKNIGFVFQISACYEYNWDSLINLFKNKIDVEVRRYDQIYYKKNQKASTIKTFSVNATKIYNYLYQTYDRDKIGLPRKHDKFKFAIDRFYSN